MNDANVLSSHTENGLVVAIKAVFAATHGRAMTRKEEADLILPDSESPFFFDSIDGVVHESISG